MDNNVGSNHRKVAYIDYIENHQSLKKNVNNYWLWYKGLRNIAFVLI